MIYLYSVVAVNYLVVPVIVLCPGGRFKKEVVLDGQSYLLLIRDEGGQPEMQVSSLKYFVFSWSLV